MIAAVESGFGTVQSMSQVRQLLNPEEVLQETVQLARMVVMAAATLATVVVVMVTAVRRGMVRLALLA